MPTLHTKSVIPPLLAIALISYSCARSNQAAVQQTIAGSRVQVESGDFQEALDSYKAASQKYPRDESLAAGYAAAVEEIKRSADSALEKGNLGLAEKIHRVLLENFSDFKSFDLQLSFSEASLRSQIKNGRMAICEKQARQALPTGDFQKALDAYKTALKEYPGDPAFTAKFLKIIEEIKAVGENSLAGKGFALAGKAYYALVNDFSDFKSFEKQLSFGRDILKAGLDKSRKSLSQKGMEQYRKGKLAEAISIWESLLVFDPDNADIKKSIETGKNQLKKLQKKNDRRLPDSVRQELKKPSGKGRWFVR